MSQYKVYPAYKDSGVEWIGQVPEHWQLRKVAWDLVMSIGWTPDTKNRRYYGGDYNWVSIADLTKNRINETGQKITQLAVDEMKGSQAPAGSLLFSYKLTIGMVALLDQPAYTNEAIAAFYPNKKINMNFWKYAVVVILPRYSRKNIYNSDLLNQELMNSARFYAPSYDEQATIAAALDRETARIDALVEKKTRFIELLKEKRQALITHAVTKGLDPNAKMKDSGVEWIGQVPEHWDVVQSRRLFSERKERARDDDKQYTSSQKYGVILQTEFMEREGRRIVLVEKGQEILKHIESGDFLISMRSFQGGIEECTSSGCVSSAYVPLRPIKWIWHSFFKYLFKSNTYIQALQRTSDLIRDGQALRFENFSKVPLLHVPISEQKDIALFLDNETARIDALISKSEQSIILLKERRAAFITAAVTGQIDLRGKQ